MAADSASRDVNGSLGVIGLALQDTLGNFFAGLSIHIEQPFHILDAIRIGDSLGRV